MADACLRRKKRNPHQAGRASLILMNYDEKNHFKQAEYSHMKQQFLAQNGTHVEIETLAPWLFHVRVSSDGRFRESPLLRYGIIRKEWPETVAEFAATPNQAVFQTEAAELSIDLADGRGTLKDEKGEVLISEAIAPCSLHDEGFTADFALTPDELLYGLGDNDREHLQRRGRKYSAVVRNVACYSPAPFLMSPRGWGLFLNSTWYHHVDAGATDPQVLRFTAPKGDLDYYLFVGKGLADLLDKYTQLSGRPALLPRWAYGLTFVCDERGVRARDVLYEAFEFRRQGIPCDVIGLEPDWMEKHYDLSTEKQWSKERFHIPFWLQGDQRGTFTAGLRRMGFKLSLWLCCDYDFSDYEERLLGNPNDFRLAAGGSDGDLFQDEHLGLRPTYFDKYTKRGEPWFEHLKKFVDDGARAFKLDGCNQIGFHPDRRWANGMDDEEMHNLYPLLYNKEMSRGFKEHTGKRPMVYSAGGYGGIQQYSATWAGDTGGGAGPLASLLNHALSGHSNTSADLQVWDGPGIHFGFLLPWSQLLSWHMYNQPWFQGEDILEMFTFYAKLRYRLLPYLYSLAAEAHRSGMPVMRPMPLAFPNDPEVADLTTQYLLGDFFLVSSFSDTLHVPAGEWVDYWTGEQVSGPKTMPAKFPENRGGTLHVRSGAIVPMAPDLAYSDHKPLRTIILDIFPGADAAFSLYEDDGETMEHDNGAFATTLFELSAMTLTIHPRRGSYQGMPVIRDYELHIHSDRELEVQTPGTECSWDPDAGLLTVKGIVAGNGPQQITWTIK